MGLIQIFKDLNENSEEREHMMEYLLSSANELDETIRNITDITKLDEDDKPSKSSLKKKGEKQ